jgi:cytochrome c
MDTYEFNKIAGAILGSVLLVMFLQNVSGILYSTHAPETPAYAVEVADEGHGGGEEAPAEETMSMAEMLSGADAEGGTSVVRKCSACHTFDAGGNNGIGPNLYGILGRAVASVEGFAYSDSFTARAGEIGTWTFETLNAFLEDPKGYVPGTKMAFAGLSRMNQRADLLMYLRDLSDNPMPLPVEEAMAEDEMMTGDDAAGEEAGASE